MYLRRLFYLLPVALLLLSACTSAEDDEIPVGPTATVSSLFTAPDNERAPTRDTAIADEIAVTRPTVDASQENMDRLAIHVDTTQSRRPISQAIYGVSGTNSNNNADLRPTLESWGGNPSTRFNWRIGNAWNTGSDWFYNNVNYELEGNVFDRFFEDKMARGIATRVAIPTLGWVAKNSDPETCSFPDEDGNCTDGQASDCENQLVVADPELTSVRSTPADIIAWLNHMRTLGGVPTYHRHG